MLVDAGSALAREWARDEIKKLNRLDLAELEAQEKKCERCRRKFDYPGCIVENMLKLARSKK